MDKQPNKQDDGKNAQQVANKLVKTNEKGLQMQLKSATTVVKLPRIPLGAAVGAKGSSIGPEDSMASQGSISKQQSATIGRSGVAGRSAATYSAAKFSPMPGLDAVDSTVSIGFSDNNADLDGSQTLIIRDGPELYKRILSTAVGFAIRCPHGKMPLAKVKDHVGHWLPYAYASENGRLLDTAADVCAFILDDLQKFEERALKTTANAAAAVATAAATTATSTNTASNATTTPRKSSSEKGKSRCPSLLNNFQLFSTYRFQIPDGEVINRYIYLAQWTGSEPSLKHCSPSPPPPPSPPSTTAASSAPPSCCKDTSNVQWISIDSIVAETRQSSPVLQPLLDHFWGYEVAMVAPALQQPQLQSGGTQILQQPLQYVTPVLQEFSSLEVMKYLSRQRQNHSTASFCQMLHEAKFTEADVIKIYCDYVQHCFPSATMTFCSFYEYFTKIGFLQFDDGSLRNVFRAMNFKNKHHMLFNEFLLGLAALDSNVPNSKLRFTYIFRYYDRNADGFLDEEDFKRLVGDIRFKANLSSDPAELDKDVKSRLAILKLLDESKRISYKAFLNEACHIGGIMHLFRTNKAILEAIHTRQAYEIIVNKYGKPFSRYLVGSCAKCRPKKYSLAYHAVRLNVQNRIDDPKALVNLSCGELDRNLQFVERANEQQLKHSMEVVFNESAVANKVLALIRKMADLNRMSVEQKKEVKRQVAAGLTVETIRKLCKEVTSILLVEPRLLKVNAPCFVLGDIHANVNDLLIYEDQLWPLAPMANASNVLFLGNYIDRGDYGIEVTCYLFAMKILAPTKFFLLRGAHEIRDVQRKYTFYQECKSKYGKLSTDTNIVFEAFNGAFDHLPIAAVIDESVFCAHGGIPFSTTKLENIFKIPCPLVDPYSQSKIAWEIFWSDPITDAQYNEFCQLNPANSPSDCFLPNTVRGTAYYFTEKALQNFLKVNELSHVIRSHEFVLEGYRFHHSGQLITVFSSGKYTGYPNRSACVFADSRDTEGFLKVISLETYDVNAAV